MNKPKDWIITTSGDIPLEKVRKSVIDAGFRIDEVLEEIGCITGFADDAVANTVKRLPGIVDVSQELPSINIGPPNAIDTW